MQTVHLSCTETNNVSKWTEARFHMTHVIKEFHRVHPNWFSSIWYVPGKSCTYLASRLALSLNRLKRDSIWYTSSRSSIGCVQIDFITYGTFHANCATILLKISTISEQTKSSLHLSLFNYEYYRVRLKWFLSLWCIRCKLCTYLAPKQTLSPNRPRDSIWHTSSRSSIGCVQIDFLTYGTFHANCATILHQD